MEINKLYELGSNGDYQSLIYPSRELENRELHQKFKYGKYKLKEEWTPLEFIFLEKYGTKKLKPGSDYPPFLSEIAVFSPKSLETLKDLLEGNGEILDIFIKDKKGQNLPYYFFNVTNVIECLDEKNTIFDRYSDGSLGRILKYSFYKDKINSNIFKIPKSFYIFVTNDFVKRVLENNLKGYRFIPVWSSDGVLGETIRT